MKNFLRTGLAVAALTLLATSHSYAISLPAAPEIDPSVALGSIVLITGSIAVIRGRRKQQ